MTQVDQLLACLRAYDTPTVCNAIEMAQGRRGFAGFTRRTVIWTGPTDARIVGFARTAKIAGRAPPTEDPQTLRARRMDYFEAMVTGPRPGIAVVEDMDGDAATGAWWGELHARIHSVVFGLEGAVTNGVVRDLGDLPGGFPILAGSVGPSHGFVHVREIGTPATIHGLTVCNGDLIHADRHGAVVVPRDVYATLQDALARLIAAEAIVLDPLLSKPVDMEAFRDLWAAFETARV
ncbi:RraA family protein [Jannaschia donghaensis]|uniref:Bifunctional hexulose-6-phosphate synthase/ribonuclease regulator n=1 Tax=Jannaschia donghaensis TaxID=420998 RepID=A0A0M6YI81_9RHOB|nr:RraA family protein [Jannaschia donghaensis]CTQ49489.1 bifunctional hexulose-6-phosphate synthase/ribonuclease regulator [Jannaschia donghaensis]